MSNAIDRPSAMQGSHVTSEKCKQKRAHEGFSPEVDWNSHRNEQPDNRIQKIVVPGIKVNYYKMFCTMNQLV